MTLLASLWDHRAKIYPLALVLAIYLVWWFRTGGGREESLVTIQGQTFGTVVYNIQYLDPSERNLQEGIDSVLDVFNQSLSTYLPTSEINRFNREGLFKFELPYFPEVLWASKKVYTETEGAFDPTVGKLIDAWGFGPVAPIFPDSSTVESLLTTVSFDSIFFDDRSLCRLKPGLELSFSAIAKGQGVDAVADYLRSKDIKDFFVEIGGEVVAQGQYIKDLPWVVGIEDPKQGVDNRQALLRVKLENRGVATSGNYRNFYMYEGKKYAHTIDPKTGFPVEHSLLSASVFAENCMLADAYATAFMVMGVQKTQAFLNDHPEIDAILIFDEGNETPSTFFTPGIKNALLD